MRYDAVAEVQEVGAGLHDIGRRRPKRTSGKLRQASSDPWPECRSKRCQKTSTVAPAH
jgi:hypothetical protein